MNIQVEILNQHLSTQIQPTDTFNYLTEKILKQLNIQKSEVSPIVYLNNQQVNSDDKINVNEHQRIKISLSKPYLLTYKHQCFEQFQFKGNYFGSIDSYLRYIQKQINRQFEYCPVKLIVDGQQIHKDTLWCDVSPNYEIQIESALDFIFNDQRKKLPINVCWDGKQVIQLLQKEFNIQDVILLKQNDQEILPTQQNISLKQNNKSLLSVKLPDIIKYSCKFQGNVVEIKINKEETFLSLENKFADKLQIPISQYLKIPDIDNSKKIKQLMIPYGTMFYCQVQEGKFPLKLKSQDGKNEAFHLVDSTFTIKDLNHLIVNEEKKDIIFYLNNEQIIDNTLPLLKLGMKRSDEIVYQIRSFQFNFIPLLEITYHNSRTKQDDHLKLAITDQIGEKFAQIIRNFVFNQKSDYIMTYKDKEVDMKLTFEEAKIESKGILIYSCRQRQVKIIYLDREQLLKCNYDSKLSDVEGLFKLKNKDIPENFTVFHGRLLNFEEKLVEDLLEKEVLEFIEQKPQPQKPEPQKIEPIKYPEPAIKQEIPKNNPKPPEQKQQEPQKQNKIRIINQKMVILKFKIYISNLALSLNQEIPANNQIKGLCECLKSKLLLPVNSRIKLFLGNQILDDNALLSDIVDGQNIDTINANILDYIEIFFENKTTKETKKQKVILDETLLQTATILKIAQCQFFYKDKLLNLKQAYKDIQILHNETIYYLPEEVENDVYLPPPDDIVIYVSVGVKLLKYELNPKTTIKTLTETIQSELKVSDVQQKFCLKYQGQVLQPHVEIGTLPEQVQLDWVLI